eukprot:GHVS01048923.1.p1 GENE.GHVS01048923.1~~GHVS01048923.1.p1  ORF type:complete len:685 (+),score=146.23 GHVS01048923.1:119-2173(+)
MATNGAPRRSMLRQVLTATELADLGLDRTIDDLPAAPGPLIFKDFKRVRVCLSTHFFIYWTILFYSAFSYSRGHTSSPEARLHLLFAGYTLICFVVESYLALQLCQPASEDATSSEATNCFSWFKSIGGRFDSLRCSMNNSSSSSPSWLSGSSCWTLYGCGVGILGRLSSYCDVLFVIFAYRMSYTCFIISLSLFFFSVVLWGMMMQIRMLLSLLHADDDYAMDNPRSLWAAYAVRDCLCGIVGLPVCAFTKLTAAVRSCCGRGGGRSRRTGVCCCLFGPWRALRSGGSWRPRRVAPSAGAAGDIGGSSWAAAYDDGEQEGRTGGGGGGGRDGGDVDDECAVRRWVGGGGTATTAATEGLLYGGGSSSVDRTRWTRPFRFLARALGVVGRRGGSSPPSPPADGGSDEGIHATWTPPRHSRAMTPVELSSVVHVAMSEAAQDRAVAERGSAGGGCSPGGAHNVDKLPAESAAGGCPPRTSNNTLKTRTPMSAADDRGTAQSTYGPPPTVSSEQSERESGQKAVCDSNSTAVDEFFVTAAADGDGGTSSDGSDRTSRTDETQHRTAPSFVTVEASGGLSDCKVFQLSIVTQLLDFLFLQAVLKLRYLAPDRLESLEFSSAIGQLGRCFFGNFIQAMLKIYLLATFGFNFFVFVALLVPLTQSFLSCILQTVDESLWEDWAMVSEGD